MSAGNSTNIYQTVPTIYGNFNQIKAAAALFSPDVVRLQIVLTQNILNLQGRVTLSVFEQFPNATFRFMNGALNAFNIAITDTELTNNIGKCIQHELKSLPDTNTHMTYIPSFDREQYTAVTGQGF